MENYFEEILTTFENEDIREFAEKCIESAPDYWSHVAASSTGKYHPSYSLGEGGLMRHTIAVVRFLNHMFGVESISDQFTSRERDLLRVAAIAHDMMKSGTQEDYEKSKWTKFNHPLLAAKMIYEMDGLSRDERKYISAVISSHMGAFNVDKRNPDIVLPIPKTKAQIIIHLADYLASRKDITLEFDEEYFPAPEQLPDINDWKFPFGKYAGKTIPEVAAENRGYITWAKKNMTSEPAKSLLKNYEI